MPSKSKQLSQKELNDLLYLLQTRFEKHNNRHPHIQWKDVEKRLKDNPAKCWSLSAMEKTGGEPDVVGYDSTNDVYVFMDCSAESPAGRRSLCYDREALEARKENKPVNNAMDVAAEMGVEILTEEQYQMLQQLGSFDGKTSSWLLTPQPLRKSGGAIFGDFRYGRVFIYHNGVQSYYAARGFRACLKV
jgi:hypothetical protein